MSQPCYQLGHPTMYFPHLQIEGWMNHCFSNSMTASRGGSSSILSGMTRVTEPWGSFCWVWLALFYLETRSHDIAQADPNLPMEGKKASESSSSCLYFTVAALQASVIRFSCVKYKRLNLCFMNSRQPLYRPRFLQSQQDPL